MRGGRALRKVLHYSAKGDFMTHPLYVFAKFIARHKFIAAPLLFLGVGLVIWWAVSLDASLDDNYSIPGSQSEVAASELSANFPQVSGPSATVVFEASDGSITDSTDEQYVGLVLTQIAQLDSVVAIINPYQETDGVQTNISQDGTTALAQVYYAEGTAVTTDLTDAMSATIDSSAQQAEALGITVVPGGNTYFITSNVGTDDTTSEALGLVAAIIVMTIAFGSLIAMGMPLLSALTGLALGLGSTYVFANWFDVSSIGPTIATMIGLGVGIDYALFIVTRYREFLRDGLPVTEAVGRAIATAGQAVIVAGLTVIIALMGLLLIDIPIMTSIAYAAAIAVASAIIVAITILPTLLALTGRGIEKLNVHHLFKTDGTKDTFARGWGKTVTAHPVRWATVAVIIFAILIAPIFGMELGPPGEDTIPANNPQRISYNIVTDKFGVGYNGPLVAVSSLPSGQPTEENSANLQAIEVAVAQTDGVATVSPPTLNQDSS